MTVRTASTPRNTSRAPFRLGAAGAAALATACLCLPVLLLLVSRVSAPVGEPLAAESISSVPVAIEIPGSTYLTTGEPYSVHHLKLVASNAKQLLQYPEIQLLVATYGTSPGLERAELKFSGTGCVYSTSADATFPNNALLTFVRGDGCSGTTANASGEIDLTVRLSNVARLAIWTYQFPPSGSPSPAAVFTYALPTAPSGSHIVRGRLGGTDTVTNVRRADLLAYVWQIQVRTTWLWISLAIAAALAFAGALLFWRSGVFDRRAIECAARAMGAAAMAASLGLLYAVLVPPFQAADEPNHFVGFAAFTNRAGLGVEASELARVGHFERIQFNADEKFRPSNVGAPGRYWDDGTNPSAELRGGGVQLLWRAISPLLGPMRVPHLLLALRLINVALFSATVAFFVALALLLTDAARPHLLAFPLFFVPTIPFFAMHVSNHALLLCAYIVMGLGVVVWFVDGRRSWTAGALVGLGWAAAVLVSRSAVPLAALVVAVLAGRLLLGGRGQSVVTTLAFWAGASIGGVAVVHLAEKAYLGSLSALMRSAGATFAASAIDLIGRHPFILLLFAAAAAAAEIIVRAIATRASARMHRASARAAVWVAGITAAAVALLLGASLLVEYPMLDAIDPIQRPAAMPYVTKTVLTALTMFRLTRPDLLTSWSFWGGFGWIDTLPDWRFVTALVVATAVSLTMLLMWIRRRQDARHMALLLLGVCGVVGSLVAYALSVVTLTPADVHGRYLLGAYLSFLLIAWSPLAVVPVRRTWIPALACMAAHGYCLTVILRRYF